MASLSLSSLLIARTAAYDALDAGADDQALWQLCDTQDLTLHAMQCGIIPETLPAGSSQEKRWAKYSDAVVAVCLQRMGYDSRVLSTRADSADVIAVGAGHGLVADAKAFRLTRTALNQKDYKIGPLARWRGEQPFALLVATVFPPASSQIYEQAGRLGVTILSFTHLAYLVAHDARAEQLPRVWQACSLTDTGKDGAAYWARIDQSVCEVTGTDAVQLAEWLAADRDARRRVAARERQALDEERERFEGMSREQMLAELLRVTGMKAKTDVLTALAGR